MTLTIERIEILLLIAAVVAMLARRLRVPYSIGLVIAGIVLAMTRFAAHIELTEDLVFTVLLPPLLFEAAFYLHWQDLRKDLTVILTLATLGVLLSAAATTLGMRYLAHWEWTSSMIFGVLIAAADPVAIIAIFKEAGARGRIRLLVEAEVSSTIAPQLSPSLSPLCLLRDRLSAPRLGQRPLLLRSSVL